MILYFSGTGNSQKAALQIAEIVEDQAVSINQYIKNEKKPSIQSQKPLVFVSPTYSWRLPRVVEQWILNAEFKGSREAYFILTCGGGCGNASAYTEKLCAKKGLKFRGLAPVSMPENYLAMFPTPIESECLTIMETARLRITALAEQIRAGEQLAPLPISFRDRLESGPVNWLFYTVFVKDKGFMVSNACVSCGKCAQRCALNNISLSGGRPVWNGNCTHCMACIGGCPTEAIEYKSKSKGRHRHYIMDDTLCQENGGENR